MGEPVINISSLEALAAGIGDSALQERAEELRTMTDLGKASAFGGSSATTDQSLALNIKNAWTKRYGTEITLWPQELQDAFETINAGIGMANFGNNISAAFQNLRLKEETMPALEAGRAVVAQFIGPDSPMNRATTTGFIPDSAARAGLHFISNPLTLVLPMWSAGLFGRAAVGGISAFGRFAGLAEESAAALSVAVSVPVEAGAFMGTSSVTQYVAQDFSPAISLGRSEDLRYTEGNTFTEFTASTLFFGGLKLFSWAGALAQSMLPATELGAALAKLTGHTTSVVGLASMDRVQVSAGISEHGSSNFNEALWQAIFLHATVQATNGIINVNGVKSDWAEVARRATDISEQGIGNWPVPVLAGTARQPTIALPEGMQRAIQEAMRNRGKDMTRLFMNQKDNEQETKRYVIPMNPRYHDGLVEFKRRCTDYDSIKQFLDQIFEGDVSEIRTFLNSRTTIRATDVGCGDGTISEHLARVLAKNAGSVQFVVVEPLEDYISQTRLKLLPFESQNVCVSYEQQKAEDYFAQDMIEKNTLVLASHSLHLISLDTLSRIADSTMPGGYFIVVIGARNSIMSHLKDMFAPRPAITGDDILSFMTQSEMGQQFDAVRISQPSFLDLRGVEISQTKGELGETAKNILSLMIQKNVDDINDVGYANVWRSVINKMQEGQLQLDNDCFIFRKRN